MHKEMLVPGSTQPAGAGVDLEIKDAQLIFSAVWTDLLEKHPIEELRFPRELIWLGGAPGAGKGTNTPFIAKARNITAPPVIVSSLLTTPQAVAMKNAGRMVGDREVIGLLFEELLLPQYHDGVIVDGFPRTQVQVECLKMFYQAMLDLHDQFRETPLARYFRKPMFRIALLFVGEEVSIQRQLKRGREIREHNAQVRASGIGELLEERPTDVDSELCRKRYRVFKETTFEALQSLRDFFPFHFVDAERDLHEVQQSILDEFRYQSSLELSQKVFERIRDIPIASELALHARQELVERLESYEAEHSALFEKVVQLLEKKVIPIVRVHSISGRSTITREDELLEDPLALRIMLDVLSERGFHAAMDIIRMDVPERIDPQTWEITCRTKKIYRLEVRYQQSEIRHQP